ncbi:MAG: hypothetical protein ABI630_02050 [Betaproteobacteria bacterium]
MKTWILPIALLGAVAVSGCERTVVTPPNAAVITPSPAVVAVPGPAGPSGPAGPQGAPGKTSTDTVVVVPPASSSEPTKTN